MNNSQLTAFVLEKWIFVFVKEEGGGGDWKENSKKYHYSTVCCSQKIDNEII